MRAVATSLVLLAAMLCGGCGNQHTETAAPHFHEAVPPHGGTPLALGDDYQIEWVLDSVTGKLQAFFMDGEMENFVRIAAPSFDVTAKVPGRDEVLHFGAVPNSATGEKVGDTCLFEAQADWLKTNKAFGVELKEINVKGSEFTNLSFQIPAEKGAK